MRRAEVFRKEVLAGVLTEDGGEYRLCYYDAYLARADAESVSLTPFTNGGIRKSCAIPVL